MKLTNIRSLLLILLSTAYFSACSSETPEPSDIEFLQQHIEWLADDERQGRLAGTIHEAEAANYIADELLLYGVEPAGGVGTYFQQFTLSGPMTEAMEVEQHLSRNVVGLIEGTEHPERYIIIGAHYDGQGMGGMISMSDREEEAIHNSADDNASGTAGLLYLARELSENPLKNSVKLVAFSAEELGLIGSRHFVNVMEIEKDSILAMVNLDMIGRLDEGDLTIFGTGTSTVWDDLLESARADSLQIAKTPSGSGSSDHTSFYEAGIPVLHYFTGVHEDYHSDTDTADKINYEGMTWILNHIHDVVTGLDQYSPSEIEFVETTDPRSITMRGDAVTLGVIPDYSYSGVGFRVESVRQNNPGADAGMEAGDIIIEMDGEQITDIYDYMNKLNDFEEGGEVSIKVLRNEEPIELLVQF